MSALYYIFILITFLAGLYYYVKSYYIHVEGFDDSPHHPRCPNVLIQKGKRIFLFNTKLAKIPGVNPIEFENLEDYIEFTEWQRRHGIRCPVLFLQNSYDTQGNSVYKIRPSITDLQGGLPPSPPPYSVNAIANTDSSTPNTSIIQNTAIGVDSGPKSSSYNSYLKPSFTKLIDAGRDDPPYNKNSLPGFDSSKFYEGTKTPLDVMDEREENLLYSANPMYGNWAGGEYTENLVKSGYYKDNEVSLRV
jgi:hypothetical protein